MTTNQATDNPVRPSQVIVDGSIESAPTVYVDGLAQMVSGPIMSKLHFFQVEKIDRSSAPPIESRRVVQTLIIPTAVLAEMASNVLKSMAQNRANLLSSFDANRQIFEKLLDQVSIDGGQSK